MKRSRVAIGVAALFSVFALVLIIATNENHGDVSLLQAIAVNPQSGPLRLYYVPTASLEQQQEAVVQAPVQPAAVVYPNNAAPIRYSYVPANAYYGSPYGAQIVRYAPVVQQAQQQQQPQELAQQLPKIPSANEVVDKHAQEITALRKALDSVETKEAKYEQQVMALRAQSQKAIKDAAAAKADVKKASHLKHWAKLEKAAAAKLKKVESEAAARAAKQNAVISKLLPKVRAEIARKRVLESRLARASLAAQSSGQMEAMERQRLYEDMQIASQFRQNAAVAKLASKAMLARSISMQKQAAADKKQAQLDIKEARASVIGARQSAEKTLKAIRAAMSKGPKVSAVTAETQEQNFARDARMATKEMSSKKRDAKALREEATHLKSLAKQLAMEAAQRKQDVPSQIAKAEASEADARKVRAMLEQTMRSSLPFSNNIASAQQLAAVSTGQSSKTLAQLADSESEYARSAALLQQVQRMTEQETSKAQNDAVVAKRRLELARSRLNKAMLKQMDSAKKLKTLTSVLSDAKQELAELKTEADDIAGSE